MRTTFVLFAIVLAGAAPGWAQVDWRVRTDLAPRHQHAMAYDSLRGRVLLFGGGGVGNTRNDLWAWDGVSWSLLSSGSGPGHRMRHAMAYDAGRDRLVVFGGEPLGGPSGLGDTWEWDGTSWTEMTPATSPPGRVDAGMVYDARVGAVIMFGGSVLGSGLVNDMWKWDGSSWIEIPASLAPPSRSGHVMVFDSVRQRIVVFGGTGDSGVLADTWEWDGLAWTSPQPVLAPFVDARSGGAFDPASGRVVVVGKAFQRPETETWTYDGATWTLVSTAQPTPWRSLLPLAHDPARGRTVLFGGLNIGKLLGDTWEFDGTSWQLIAPAQSPADFFFGSGRPRIAFDSARGVSVLTFRGALWEDDGARWLQRVGVSVPSTVFVTYDSTRSVVLALSSSSGNPEASTWQFDGSTWTALSPVHSPTRFGNGLAALAFDPVRERAVYLAAPQVGVPWETWEWDGADWTQRTTTVSPVSRVYPAVAWHPHRQSILMYGGGGGPVTSFPLHADFWEWDGTSWALLDGMAPPGKRTQHAMVFDGARQRLVLHGGQGAIAAPLSDSWEWDEVAWVERSTAGSPAIRAFDMVFDPVRRRAVLFGLEITQESTWVYGPAFPATTSSFGTACPGSTGTPQLSALTLPWLGTDFSQKISGILPGTTTILEFGVSNTTWGPLLLPYDLSSVGMTGCTQYTNIKFMANLVADPAGEAQFDVALPNVPALLDSVLYTQAFSADLAANPLGATTSNALEVRLGGL